MAKRPMKRKPTPGLALHVCVMLMLTVASGVASAQQMHASVPTPIAGQRAPLLGADVLFADDFSPLIDAWQDKQQGDEMAAAFGLAGLRSLRFSSHGYYSARGDQATQQV